MRAKSSPRLGRPTCQFDYYQRGGSTSLVYGMGRNGAAYLRSRDDAPPRSFDWTARNRSIHRLFLEHALLIAEVMLAFERACRHHPNVRLLVDDTLPLPAETRQQREPFHWNVTMPGGRRLGVIPNKVFAVVSPRRRRTHQPNTIFGIFYLIGRVLSMTKEVVAVCWGKGIQSLGGGVPEAAEGALGALPQEGFELGKGPFDRIEVGTVGGQIPQLGTAIFDRLTHAADLM